MKRIFAGILFLSVLVSLPAREPEPFGLLQELFSSCSGVRSMRYLLNKGERIEGEMVYQKSYSKLTYFPFRFYSRSANMENGEEILYVTGWNDNKALINPNYFPWTNLNLDPKGKLMRRGQHHTLLDAGYIKVIPIIEWHFREHGDGIHEMLKMGGDCEVGGAECWTVYLDNVRYEWQEYEVKKGENILSLATERNLAAYRIMEENPDLKDYWDVQPGQKILIPTSYAARMEIYVEKERKVMRGFKVFDEKGVYEHFEFLELELNPTFAEDEFSSENPDYDF